MKIIIGTSIVSTTVFTILFTVLGSKREYEKNLLFALIESQ